jgi:NAD(P)-dependent dehydrogenase (short-subunit alcohol dehydrogenase family)
MDLGFAGAVAAITGGTSGIGLATARAFLSEGADVAICGRDVVRLQNAQVLLANEFGADRITAVRCDVTNAEQVQNFAKVVNVWRGRVDILVNNAGQGRMSNFATTTDENWREELELKYFSQIHPVRAFLPMLEASDKAAIVAVNSLLAYQPEPYMVCTSAARAGVQSLLKSLASEFAGRIRVNSVVLGLIDSGQWQRRFEAREDQSQTRDEWIAALAKSKHIPAGRLGTPEEVARAVVFLASSKVAYITGASLEISGGVSRYI